MLKKPANVTLKFALFFHYALFSASENLVA